MAYRFTYSQEVRHSGLGKCRVISGSDFSIVAAKVKALEDTWNAEYKRKQAKERLVADREATRQRLKQQKEQTKDQLEENRLAAEDLTSEAQAALEQLANTLHSALSIQHSVSWEKLKRKDSYSEPKPKEPSYLEFPREPQPNDSRYVPPPENPIFLELPREPQSSDAKYQPVLTLFDKFSGRDEKKIQALQEIFFQDHAAWEISVKEIEAENQRKVEAAQRNDIENQQRAKELYEKEHDAWVAACQKVQAKNEKIYSDSVAAIEAWNKAALEHAQNRDQENAAIDNRKVEYESLVPDAVSDYCELVLAASEYPDSFPKEFETEYVAETKILVVDYSMPSPDEIPRVKEVKYVKTKDDMVEVFLSETEANRIYDNLLYQICLRTIHELFDADSVDALSAVVFNGWVKSTDKATGKEVNNCLISVQAKKEEFRAINLGNVDAKACFKAMKGIGSSKLHSLTAVAPVLKINREDKRFIPSREVENQLNEGFNLAAMDWEDFEQLVREIFEKEFNTGGGEVKVTQASRDGGVDAVAFDPDPIHGGKIVIQAKRYTNTVGVGFVRELWGTVLNEGAMKGILITTADYGPDAYEFAQGKPITLMNGANLLYLLEKHGRKAKIDIREAKKILGEKVN